MICRSKAGVAAICLASAGLWASAAAAEAPDVVVSIKPVHSLVAAVMEGVGTPTLLVQGGNSPHTYALRPSDARALNDADVIFWIGGMFETFLVRPLETLPRGARVVALSDAPGMALLETRAGGAWETHRHDHDEAHDHGHEQEAADTHDDDDAHGEEDHPRGPIDGHVWLDPGNARAIVEAAASALSAHDPDNAGQYRTNAAAAIATIKALDGALAQTLAPVRDVPYVVFHDAYQYFEAHFGLAAVGSITVSPEVQPGAGRLVEVREKIQDLGARCVFSEPQFEPRLVETVTEGLSVGHGVLDPEGTALDPGPDLYPALMHGLAESLVACLGRG